MSEVPGNGSRIPPSFAILSTHEFIRHSKNAAVPNCLSACPWDVRGVVFEWARITQRFIPGCDKLGRSESGGPNESV